VERLLGGLTLLLVLGTACESSGRGELIAAWPSQVRTHAVDRDAVYGAAANSILRVPLSGGAVTTLRDGENYVEPGLGLTSDEVIWSESTRSLMEDIRAVPKSGGASRTIAADQPFVTSLATDGSSVFWSTYETVPSDVGSLRSSPLHGGPITVLQTIQDGAFTNVAVDATRVYFTRWVHSVLPSASGLFAIDKDGANLAAVRAGACCATVDPPSLFLLENSVLRKVDMTSGTITDVGSLPPVWRYAPRWVLADRQGGVAVYAGCDSDDSEDEEEESSQHCWSAMVDLVSRGAIAYAEATVDPRTWVVAAAMDVTYVYWSPGGFDLRRVPRR
jgi:hypothetical protein